MVNLGDSKNPWPVMALYIPVISTKKTLYTESITP